MRALRDACALVYFIGAVGAHVAIDIELMVADSAPLVAGAAEILVVGEGAEAALAGHEVGGLRPGSRQGDVLISHEDAPPVAQVAVLPRVLVFAVPAPVVTL